MLLPLAILLQIVCQLVVMGSAKDVNINIFLGKQPVSQTPAVPKGYTAFLEDGVAYKFYNNSRTWNSARKDCIADGAHLAVVDSVSQQDRVRTVSRYTNVWVGVHRLFDGLEWVTEKTGLALEDKDFLYDVRKKDTNCVSINWIWGSADLCSNTHPFVCEIGI